MSKPQLMFIDDEERIVRSLAMQFQTKYKVKTCTDPAEALNLVQQEHFHVVISDQRMPKMQGVELLRQTRQLSPNSIGILLTGYADLPAITAAINEGEIFRYVTKPWDRDELSRVIGNATEIAKQMEQQSAATAATTQAASTCNKQIIVIDDSSDIHAAIVNQFQDRYPVHWAHNLELAYELLADQHVALVITDLKLKGEDITPVLKTLKHHNPNVIAIVLTSMQDSELLISLINQAQIFRYLPKPIRFGLLDKSVDAALAYHEKLHSKPELVKRHQVEQLASEHVASKSILSFLSRMRGIFVSPMTNSA